MIYCTVLCQLLGKLCLQLEFELKANVTVLVCIIVGDTIKIFLNKNKRPIFRHYIKATLHEYIIQVIIIVFLFYCIYITAKKCLKKTQLTKHFVKYAFICGHNRSN